MGRNVCYTFGRGGGGGLRFLSDKILTSDIEERTRPNSGRIEQSSALSSASDHHQTSKYLPDCVSTVSAASVRYRQTSTGSAAYVLPRTRTKFGERGFFCSGPAACMEHSSIRPSWHYWYEYIPETTQECTFCFDRAYNWLLLALLDESYSGALQISRWLLDWLY